MDTEKWAAALIERFDKFESSQASSSGELTLLQKRDLYVLGHILGVPLPSLYKFAQDEYGYKKNYRIFYKTMTFQTLYMKNALLFVGGGEALYGYGEGISKEAKNKSDDASEEKTSEDSLPQGKTSSVENEFPEDDSLSEKEVLRKHKNIVSMLGEKISLGLDNNEKKILINSENIIKSIMKGTYAK